jgi:putative phosphoesterase
MRFAVISDVHSNLYALSSVLADISKKDVDFILCTGDTVGYSPFPNEVIELLKRNKVISIQGNYDKAIGNKELICGCDYQEQHLIELAELSVAYTNNTISDNNREYLKNLPQELRIKGEKLSILLVHGSPRRINEPLGEDSPELAEILENLPEDVLIIGHTHTPYYRKVNNKHIINSGTVGKPANGNPDSTYALVDIVKSTVDVAIVKVGYDVMGAAQAIEETDGLPNEFAAMLRKGGK